MKMRFEQGDGIGFVHVDETRIDASVAIQFKDTFRGLVGEGPDAVVLDLSTVEFLDSSGLGAVVAVRKLLGKDRVMALSGLLPAVDKVMTLTRMNTVFPIFEDVETALAAHMRDKAG